VLPLGSFGDRTKRAKRRFGYSPSHTPQASLSPHHAGTALDVSSVPLSLTIILHVAVDEAQGAAPSDLSSFGGKAIAFVSLEAVISVIGVDVDRLSEDSCGWRSEGVPGNNPVELPAPGCVSSLRYDPSSELDGSVRPI
jgi:hypothetical protein